MNNISAKQTTVAPFPATPATIDANNIHPDETEQDETIVKYEQVFDIDSVEADDSDTRGELRVNTLNVCFETTCDALRKFEVSTPEQDESLLTTRELMRFSDSCTHNDTDSEDFDTQTTSQGEFPISEAVEPVATHTGVEKVYLNTDNDVGNIVKEDNIVRSFSVKRIAKMSYICDVCQHKFQRKNVLVKHIRSHTEENLFTCKLCNYKFKYKCASVRHMRTHTVEKKPFACKLCHYMFSKRSLLVTHMRTHTGEKPFTCKLCEYKFSHKGSLVTHMRTHTGEKPFACQVCQYKCAFRGNLVSHMRTHTGDKPFACKLCEYKCARKHSLLSHMRTHTGEKPYACELCQYKCSEKSSLVKHMRTHTGKTPLIVSCGNTKVH